MTVFDLIDQPTLLLNSEIARGNLRKMAHKVAAAGVRFRPHFKTHQSAEIGTWFREAGVSAITVSSVEMAEYFADHGWEDILIAFSVNIRQIERIHKLAQKVSLGVLVENGEAVQALSEIKDANVDAWIKVDVGNHRTGLDWTQTDQVAGLCRQIKGYGSLHLRGLLTHSGNTYHCENSSEIVPVFRQGVERLNSLRQALAKIGIEGLEISVGDTPGCSLCEDFSGIDELRPGNFIFFDAQQLKISSCRAEEIAVAVACPVVALHPDRNEVVIYGGAIHLSKDTVKMGEEFSYGLVALPEDNGWGRPLENCTVRSLSQEHGLLQFKQGSFPDLKVGDWVVILPAHSCLTVQVLRRYMTFDGRVIETLNR